MPNGGRFRERPPLLFGTPYRRPSVAAPVQEIVGPSAALKSVVGQSVEELRKDFAESPDLDGIDYRANYNRDSILDVTMTENTTGAYPDSDDYYVSLDLKTGRKIKASLLAFRILRESSPARRWPPGRSR